MDVAPRRPGRRRRRWSAAGSAEGRVEDGAVLGRVDVAPGEHRGPPLLDARGAARRRAAGPSVSSVIRCLRVVEEQVRALGGHPRRALRVLREQVAQVDVLDRRVMGEEGLPLGRLVDGRAGGRSGGHRAERTPLGRRAPVRARWRVVGSMHRMLAGGPDEGWNRRRASLYSPRPRSTIDDTVRLPRAAGADAGNGEHSDRRHSPDPRDGRPRVGRQRRTAHQHLASRPGPGRRPDRRRLRHRPGCLHRRGRRPRRPREDPERSRSSTTA